LSQLTLWAVQNCNGRIAVILEGGYDLDAAGSCGLATVGALTGRSWEDRLGPAPYAETRDWQRTITKARQIWELS